MGRPPHQDADVRAVDPLLGSVLVAMVVFVAAARVDQGAVEARYREDAGLLRGSILDRNGRLLAYTVEAGYTASRIYSLPDLAPVIGYRDPYGRWHGLERIYSSYLDADRSMRDWRTFFLNLTGRATRGGNLQLTLDRTLQETADAALGRNKGAVVALDPRTGDVLALVTKPYCSPYTLRTASGLAACRRAPDHPLVNRALQLLLPPGSSFKIVTLSAALDTRRFSLSTVFGGADVWGPSPYFDNSVYPSNITRSDLTVLTLRQALAFSDNFTFAHIGLTLGAPTLLRYAHCYYVGRRIPFDYQVARSSIANGDPHPTTAELAQSSFGAEVDHVTALQMALIVETVANGGVMMAPHLVKALESPTGGIVRRYVPRVLSHVTTPQGDRSVVDGMVFVVDHGSGFNARIPGVKVGAKTGTAASGSSLPHAWFIAFAPAYHPVVAVAVLREFAGEAFKYAAPIARKVLVAALREQGYHVR